MDNQVFLGNRMHCECNQGLLRTTVGIINVRCEVLPPVVQRGSCSGVEGETNRGMGDSPLNTQQRSQNLEQERTTVIFYGPCSCIFICYLGKIMKLPLTLGDNAVHHTHGETEKDKIVQMIDLQTNSSANKVRYQD